MSTRTIAPADKRHNACLPVFLRDVALMALTMISVLAHAQPAATADFLEQQKQYARVRTALKNKGSALDRKLTRQGLQRSNLNVLIVAYKAEAILEIYAKAPDAARYQKLDSYRICASSGKLGPKREAGDKQVPEGFYQMDRFNPASHYHLSLGINYPNAADKLKTRAADPGGDIFIHGNCVTIGCLPMTDKVIEEIYLVAVYARDSGQKGIPVYIFPFRMTEENMKKYGKAYRHEPDMRSFWRNLKQGHDQFIENGKALEIRVLENGDYGFGS